MNSYRSPFKTLFNTFLTVTFLLAPTVLLAQTPEPDLTIQLATINYQESGNHEVIGMIRNAGNANTQNSWETELQLDLGCTGVVDQTTLLVNQGRVLPPGGEVSFAAIITITQPGDHCIQALVNPNFGSFTESVYTNNLSGQLNFPSPGIVSESEPSDPPEIEFFAARKNGDNLGWERGSLMATKKELVEVTWNTLHATECEFIGSPGSQSKMKVPSTKKAASGITKVNTSNVGTLKLGLECSGPGGTITAKPLHIGVLEPDAPIVTAEVSVNGGPWSTAGYLAPSDEYEIRWSVAGYDPTTDVCAPGWSLDIYNSTRNNLQWRSHITNNRLGIPGNGFDIGGSGSFSTEYAHPTFGNILEPVTTGHQGFWTAITCTRWKSDSQYEYVGQSIEFFTVEEGAAAPVVDLMGRSGNQNQWRRNSFTIGDKEVLQLRWESTDASSCNSTDFETYGSPINIQLDIEEPNAGDSRTFTITCSGPGGTGSDSITVNSSKSEVYTPPTDNPGSDVDLRAVTPGLNITGIPTNNIDGTYLNLPTLLQIENLGPNDLPAVDIGYFATLDLDSGLNSSDPQKQTSIGTFGSGLDLGEASPTLTRTFSEIPFGDHELCAEVNTATAGGISVYPETNFKNNVNCSGVSLPVPPPPMLLLSSSSFIRNGQSTQLEWEVNVSYELNCRVTGPTVSSPFSTPAQTNGSIITNELESTSIFELTCTEPVTGTTFKTNTVVEVVPTFQEV